MQEPRVVSQAYADEQGCLCAFFRQQKCCLVCWFNCVRWCLCAQIPLLLICLGMCLSWFLWSLPLRCCQRAFGPRRSTRIEDVMTPKAVDGISPILFFARERIETKSLYFDDSSGLARVDTLEESCSVGEEDHAA